MIAAMYYGEETRIILNYFNSALTLIAPTALAMTAYLGYPWNKLLSAAAVLPSYMASVGNLYVGSAFFATPRVKWDIPWNFLGSVVGRILNFSASFSNYAASVCAFASSLFYEEESSLLKKAKNCIAKMFKIHKAEHIKLEMTINCL
jgi:zinc transporter ZupT